MSDLFKPVELGNLQLKNRFIQSATTENMALETGEVTDNLIKRYQDIAKGEVGLAIPGYMYVHKSGRSLKHQAGIHSDDMIPGLKKLTAAVHGEGGKIVFQIAHAGRQTTKKMAGQQPLGPSAEGRDPINFVKPKEMTEDEIHEAIKAFGAAAARAVAAGADGVQLHAAHGYLINQFLSPFFNHRKDAWGGSDVNRFRFLKEIIDAVKQAVPQGTPVLIKLNSNDFTPKEGITPALAATYAKMLAETGIDGVEISCGSPVYSYMNMAMGDVPVNELAQAFPFLLRPMVKLQMKTLVGKYGFDHGYNVDAAKVIKPALGNIPVSVVGGIRTVSEMNDVLDNKYADCISMARPFIREPDIVKKIKEGQTDTVACGSCNKCLAAVVNDMPVKCYHGGFPKK